MAASLLAHSIWYLFTWKPQLIIFNGVREKLVFPVRKRKDVYHISAAAQTNAYLKEK